MKNIIFILVFALNIRGLAQTKEIYPERYTAQNKGKIFVYWGGNREKFSKSDIHFRGEDYNFMLYDVRAKDKPKGWHIDYLNPANMTIPQTNLRIGYFITDHYNISLGVDHMKYVMVQERTVNYSGEYPNRGSYGEAVSDGSLLLTEDFLMFEHTDGLNYINVEFARVDDLSKYLGIINTDIIQLNLTEGLGAGILFPKTNSTLLGKERHDDFHVSGYGISAKAGLNATFLKHFFVQAELKGGFINMGNIRTTNFREDKASQKFYFIQTILAFGGIFRI